ncbi:UDP-glucuronosyltransferase 3A1-like isoform X2 [Pleurodeles waltl]|uniref:UDP-glucuronosyltransferase 3A1-like isoform X2 n=1 Tax=Pleurodeles waltl TaxID=8319 RepID=UPI00370950AA
MAGIGNVFFCSLFMLNPLVSESAKILTVALVGRSKHDPKSASSYKIMTSLAEEESETLFEIILDEHQKTYLEARFDYLQLMGHFARQCNILLNQSKIFNSLETEKYDIVIVDSYNPCSFLFVEKLGLPFVSFFPSIFAGGQINGIPSPLSYVPVFKSCLTDHMDFWGSVKNVVLYVTSKIFSYLIHKKFDKVIEDHFQEGARPVLPELYQKTELWLFNTDFSIDFARPLLPNTIHIGGILARPANPVSQELEEFIATSGDAGFIVVTLGSLVSSVRRLELLEEMNAGFALMPQKVIWRYQQSKWPTGLKLAPNANIFDWLPQNDLIGHPKVRLAVTHGGMNSLMESIYHGVPVLGIPLFGDQFDNMVRVTEKKMGIAIPSKQLTRERFTTTMKQLIEDPRYKLAAAAQSKIHRSEPFPPDQKLVRWIEHIIACKGGAHLRPYSIHQPWYRQCLLDVMAFLFTSVAMFLYLCVKLLRTVLSKLLREDKLKKP